MKRYYRHIVACNVWDPRRFVPFLVGDTRIGWFRVDRLRLLGEFPDVFEGGNGCIRLAEKFATKPERSEAIDRVGRALVDAGHVAPYRNEVFAAATNWDAEPLFDLDRGLLPFFGVKGYGVHLNGYFQAPEGLGMWIGRRSATKKVDPLKLDNVVAGGISGGFGILETLIKEGAEEASMTPALLSAARSAGTIRYRFEIAEGMRDDVLFVYDLETPDSFIPVNTDGEFDSFERMPLTDCLALVAETEQFKFNVNLTVIDFAIRHGLIPSDHPEFPLLERGLRGALIIDP